MQHIISILFNQLQDACMLSSCERHKHTWRQGFLKDSLVYVIPRRSTVYRDCYIKQIVNEGADWSDQARCRAWQLMDEQLSPSSKTVTVYRTLLTGFSTHKEAKTKQKQSQVSLALPAVCHDFVWVTMLKRASHKLHLVTNCMVGFCLNFSTSKSTKKSTPRMANGLWKLFIFLNCHCQKRRKKEKRMVMLCLTSLSFLFKQILYCNRL